MSKVSEVAKFKLNEWVGVEDFLQASFRQRLSRARKDLYNFMDRKCGLLNENIPLSMPKENKWVYRSRVG